MLIERGMTAVITGAGSGIGRSMAEAFAERGLNVVVADIDAAQAQKVAAALNIHGGKSVAIGVDVARREQVQELAEAVYDEFGGAQILANNAGIVVRPSGHSWETRYESQRRAMDVNYWGVLHGQLEFIPRMLAAGRPGHVVNTSSIGSLLHVPGGGAYVVSKAAIDALSMVTRKELEEHEIGVSVLHPGRVSTNIYASAADWAEKHGYQSDTHGTTEAPTRRQRRPGTREVMRIPAAPEDEITPDAIGWLVIRAIELNLPRILTHPLPDGFFENHRSEFELGLPDYSAWPGR